MNSFRGQPGQATVSAAVIGSLASLDLILADSLLSVGVDAWVLRDPASAATAEAELADLAHMSANRVLTYGSEIGIVRLLRKVDFVYTYTATLGFAARHYVRWLPVLRRLGWPPYMNICSGSDIMERALAQGRASRIQRLTLRRAFINNISNVPGALRAAAILRLRNAYAAPGLFIVPDVAGYDLPQWRRSPDELVVLHPSHLDWGATDAGPSRVSTKGNDRFLRGAALAAHRSSRPFRLVLVDRGPDRELARQLVGDLELSSMVTWTPALSRAQLFGAMLAADLVVDQFDVGALGGIAFEAMSLGRPVLTYLQPQCNSLYFDAETPVLNARTEEEIAEQLLLAADPDWLKARAEAVRNWVASRTNQRFVPRYVLPMLLATGKTPLDFGWGTDGALADRS